MTLAVAVTGAVVPQLETSAHPYVRVEVAGVDRHGNQENAARTTLQPGAAPVYYEGALSVRLGEHAVRRTAPQPSHYREHAE